MSTLKDIWPGAEPEDLGVLPQAFNGCRCHCHSMPGVRHVVACCSPTDGTCLCNAIIQGVAERCPVHDTYRGKQ